MVADIESPSLVDRKNKAKKMVKKKKKEANKVPVITYTVADVDEFVSVKPFSLF